MFRSVSTVAKTMDSRASLPGFLSPQPQLRGLR